MYITYTKFINKLNEDFQIEKDHLPTNYVGQVQYYFSDINSLYPLRDVLNTQKSGFKTEPHIEIGAENFLKQCMQSNIIQVIKNNVKYLFLLTRCMNKTLKEYYNKQYIVGYIEIENVLDVNRKDIPWKSIQGKTKIVNWEDAIPVSDYYTRSFDRPRIGKFGKFDDMMVNEFLNRFKDKKDITDILINEIKRIDKDNISCIGQTCEFYKNCKRWN